ncbi:hypothetical protein SAMN02745206_03594 [Desulfacinum infernum DSM 9756]|jgi:hypothetical protein|uniref:Uncharacterized protein n=1 Tax=Desulfacinum infernum DSM 9756 TaxID=1121391 RepID=A0A1M5IGJ0_9BACT|nr:hypothetical protein SAMN02745206_03594 [Desulfacinum infernum DSM 9756]
MAPRSIKSVPPEIVIEPPSRNRSSWFWAICQPDAAWAEIRSGYALTREEAAREAQKAMAEEIAGREREVIRTARRSRRGGPFPG